MQDKPIQDETTSGLSERDYQRAVFELLLCQDGLWTVDEIVRELSSPELDVIDAIAGLQAAGLVHRYADVVFATRAARRSDEILSS
jgi:ABC-type uncharacterized transport system substrate-binding protein